MLQKKACDACYKRKIHCALKSPDKPCDWCEHHDLECTFNRRRGRQKRAKPRSAAISDELGQRLERIETALATLSDRHVQSALMPDALTPSATGSTPRTQDESPGTESPSTADPAHGRVQEPHVPGYGVQYSVQGITSNQIHCRGNHLGHISFKNAIPVLSEAGRQWITSKTGEQVSFDRFHVDSVTWPLHLQLHHPPENMYALPPRVLVEKALHAYRTRAFCLAFPVIDHVLFERTIDTAYSTAAESLLSHMSAKACVLSFVAISPMFQIEPADINLREGDEFAAKANHTLSYCLEETTLVTLQAVFMLYIHRLFSGRYQTALSLLAMACRMICLLGGHEYKPTAPVIGEHKYQEREDRQLRFLFWCCYMMDKESSLRYGQPPFMSDDFIDTTPPDNYLECYDWLRDLDDNLSIRPMELNEKLVPHFTSDPGLSYIKGKTYLQLYSAAALKKSDAQVLRDIRELDAELEAWRQTVPQEFRPALFIREDSQVMPADAKIPRRMRGICLHIEYHYLIVSIHRASDRCLVADMGNTMEERLWNEAIQSSIDLALEASRSTLVYLRAAMYEIPCDLFWFISLYPVAAVMGLFFNILMRPLHPQAQDDLRLISSAAEITRSVPVLELTANEMQRMKLVDEFAAELTRLGGAAISKATREQQQPQSISREVCRYSS